MKSDSEAVEVRKRVFLPVLISMSLLWLSFPPIGWWPLAWAALVPLANLVLMDSPMPRRSWRKIWLAGLIYWLGTFYFIPIPHPLLWFGWIAISLYLACYLPIFVLASRYMTHKLRVPASIALPVCWTGLELIRSHLFTGMGLVCLSHTQFRQPLLIQISDLSGAYLLSFAIVCVNVSVASMWRWRANPKLAALKLGPGLLCVAAVLLYGWHRIETEPSRDAASAKVVLVQGSIDTEFPASPEERERYLSNRYEQYYSLNQVALTQHEDADLVVWPENGWPIHDLLPDTDTSQMPIENVRWLREESWNLWARNFANGPAQPVAMVGAASVDPVAKKQFGSVLVFDKQGQILDRYFKNHLVMFGEYVPLADWIPLLQKFPAIGSGLDAGTSSTTIEVNGVRFAPSICFESTVPHYIRRQINGLAEDQQEPDVMVNVTNDGWFYGTSCLDFHLACNVFRAVEMRKTHLVCANTGLSAFIDPRGKIIREGARRELQVIAGAVSPENWTSPYRRIRDLIPIIFAVAVIASWIAAISPFGASRVHGD